jgi:hypothetical protein
MKNMSIGVENINIIFIRDQKSPPPINKILAGVAAATLSSQGVKICHPI